MGSLCAAARVSRALLGFRPHCADLRRNTHFSNSLPPRGIRTRTQLAGSDFKAILRAVLEAPRKCFLGELPHCLPAAPAGAAPARASARGLSSKARPQPPQKQALRGEGKVWEAQAPANSRQRSSECDSKVHDCPPPRHGLSPAPDKSCLRAAPLPSEHPLQGPPGSTPDGRALF